MKLAQRVQKIKPSPTLEIAAKAAALKAKGIDVISFAAGEPDFDTPDYIKAGAIEALKSGFTKYTAVGGIDELKDAITTKLKRDNGLSYTREEILVSNGGKHSLYNAAEALFEAGDEVIIPAPYWVSYPDQVILNDATPVFLETSDQTAFKVVPELLEKAITKKTRAFILNSPSNPTGSAYTKEDLLKLATVLLKHKIICISDEIYEKIIYDGFEHVSIASLSPEMKALTLVVNGASKVYSMTGWRMGFAAGPKELIAAMTKIQGQSTSNISSITQKACLAAYTGDESWLKPIVAEFKKRRDTIVSKLNTLPGVKCLSPQGAFYVFPHIAGLFGKNTPDGQKILNSRDLCNYLLEKYLVAAVSGEGFGAEGYMRLSYATSMKNIEKGLERMEKAIKGLKA